MEPNVAPSPGTLAPYGRACSNCARAKAKCVAGNGIGARCERCSRLNKDCQPIQTVRRRKTVNRPSASKTGRLEEKLDGLFKLLQSSTPASTALTSTEPSSDSSQSHGLSPQDAGGFGPRSTQQLSSNRPQTGGLRLNSPMTTPDAVYSHSSTSPTMYHCPDNSLINEIQVSANEAEEYLNSFRPHMATYLPFVNVSQSTTAHQLRQDRPFLWLCIMSISSKFTAQQKALGKEIKLTMGREILVEGKNNLDLLLGILVFVAWGHYHIHEKPIIIQATQLAMALVGNLGLNKPPIKESSHMMLNLDARGCPIKPSNSSTRTTEERRAVLGCFFLSSVTSSYFRRLDALRWTPYLDECIAVLAENKEYSTDALLVQLVKLQLIIERVDQGPWHEEQNDPTGSIRAPPTFYSKALQMELQDFKAKVPPDLQTNDVLLLHIYGTELRVHEIALMKTPVIINSPGFERLDALYACLRAIKSWFDIFLSFPPASHVGFTIPIFTQMAQCVIALFRLLTFDDPSWDRGLVQDTVNLSFILEQLIEKSSQVKVAADLDRGTSEDNDVFSINARTQRSIKGWWDAKLAAESIDNSVAEEEINMDFFDDVWLRDILGQGDGQFEPNMQWSNGGTGV